MMKRIALMAIALVAAIFMVSEAMAFSLGALTLGTDTEVKFQLADLYDWGRTYSYNGTTFANDPTNTNPYAGNDPATSIPDGDNNSYGPGWADTYEDTWGITHVLQIVEADNPSNVLWSYDPTNTGSGVNNPNNHSLEIFFYGFDDTWVEYQGTDVLGNEEFDIWSTGGHIEVWEDSNPELWTSIVYQGVAARNKPGDPTYYDNVTDDGTLVLDLTPNYFNGYSLYLAGFNYGIGAGSGGGIFDVTGLGTQDHQFDSNLQVSPFAFQQADFQFNYNLRPLITAEQNLGWIIKDSPNAYANTVPEPASMLLLGSGLLGLAGLGRKRFRRK